MTAKHELDGVDRKILRLLTTDGRQSYQAIADEVGDEPRMRQMLKHPGVLECHHVAGDDCYVLKVVAPSLESLQDVLRDLKGNNKNMTTRTTIVLGTVFEKPGLVLTEPD